MSSLIFGDKWVRHGCPFQESCPVADEWAGCSVVELWHRPSALRTSSARDLGLHPRLVCSGPLALISTFLSAAG